MALFGYFKKLPANTAGVPYPSGPLSTAVPPETIIAANRQVRTIQQATAAGSKRARGNYSKVTAKDKATIGAYASLHGACS